MYKERLDNYTYNKFNILLRLHYCTHLTASFPGQPGQAGTRNLDRTISDFNKARDDGWQWLQLDHANHLNFAPDG